MVTKTKKRTSYIITPTKIRLRRRRVLESLARAMLRLPPACETAQGGAPVISEEDWRISTRITAPTPNLVGRSGYAGAVVRLC